MSRFLFHSLLGPLQRAFEASTGESFGLLFRPLYQSSYSGIFVQKYHFRMSRVADIFAVRFWKLKRWFGITRLRSKASFQRGAVQKGNNSKGRYDQRYTSQICLMIIHHVLLPILMLFLPRQLAFDLADSIRQW
jgi:hypothetical protein